MRVHLLGTGGAANECRYQASLFVKAPDGGSILLDTGNGLVHGACVPGVANCTRTEYEEGVDVDQTFLNGIGPNGPYSTIDGGVLSIDPNKLPRDPFAACAPVYRRNIRCAVAGGCVFRYVRPALA